MGGNFVGRLWTVIPNPDKRCAPITEGEFGSANLLISGKRGASGCPATSNVWEAFLDDSSAPCRGSARLDVWK